MASLPLDGSQANAGSVQKYDVIVIGAGFSGIANIHRLRKDGFNVHCFEAASDFGGVWYWNRYPGARVDSEAPFYQLNIPEVYNTWTFSQRFSDHKEMRRYMAHVDKVLNISKDVSFNSKVTSAEWDKSKSEWVIKTNNGKHATARFIVLASGLLHVSHEPQFPGMDKYKGNIHHSGAWPEDTSMKGKKVAVIGAGATSVQIVQELAKEADQLTLFMRRPSYCMPMYQRTWTEEEQKQLRGFYPTLFAAGRNSAVGFPTQSSLKKVKDDTPEEREKFLENLWTAGGFQFQLRGYTDVAMDKEANAIVYDFWKRKVRQRLTDPKKQELMCPDVAPYYFGTKRIPLENDYYDVLNQPNVEIVDLKAHPIETFTEKGIKLGGEEKDREFDYVAMATGFDSFTGSLTHMGLKNKDGVDIGDVWKDGVRTYLGMMMHGFPNAFMVYTPQAPTAFSNGPTILEAQTDFICDTIAALDKESVKTIEPTVAAEDEWRDTVNSVVKYTLYPYTDSWWNGANIPGKKSENMTYMMGINKYEQECREKMAGWKGFEVTSSA